MTQKTKGQATMHEDKYLKCLEYLQTFQEEFNIQAVSEENEFLEIGDKLRDFRNRSIGIAGIATSVVNIISGEDLLKGIDRLNSIQEHIDGYMDHTKTELQTVMESLKDILNIHSTVYVPVENFIKIVKGLRMLGIHIKILSAELPHESGDFKALAADIASLASVIEKKTTYILSRTKESILLIRETISKIDNLISALDNLTSKILEGTRSTVSYLSDKHAVSSTTAGHIALRSKQIYQGIEKIIEHLQIHDIARQQTEAVKSELERLKTKIDNTAIMDGTIANEMNICCTTQSAQLSYVRDELSEAVKGIGYNLREISKEISLVLEDTRNLAGATSSDDRSFFMEMESGISTVLSSMSESFFQCDKTRRELSEAVETVVSMIGNISDFIKDIEQIGIEMELLSFNTRIKAAHTGDLGAGLTVLAQAVQELSSDVCERTIDLSNIFKDVTNAAAGLSAGTNLEKKERDSEVNDIMNKMEELLENMRRNNSGISSSLATIAEECMRLRSDIEMTVSGIRIEQISHSIDKVISGLNYISRQTSYLIPSGTEAHHTVNIPSLFEFRRSANVELF